MIIYSLLWREYVDGEMRVNPLGLAGRAAKMALTLAHYGCNAVLWPPLTMSQSGQADNADGYGKVRDLDVGQWSPTRWGTALEVKAAIQSIHAAGMMALEDAVIHQYEGSLPIYELGAEGSFDHNLFPKGPSCFVPQVAADDVFDSDGNSAFGQMVSFQNSKPAGYMLHGTIQAMQWRRRALGLDGGRLDDTKGEASSVSARLIERVGGWWFGECFDGNPTELARWVRESGGKRTLDFTLHWAIKAACEGSVSLRALPGNGFYAWDPDHSVLFVESADTDNNNGENVRFNKIWGYLLILTLPAAAALIYAGDYERYGLAAQINNLMWISSTFAFGNLRWEHAEDDAVVWSRDGDGGAIGWSGGLLLGIARGVAWSGWTRTPFAPSQHLHDYSGHGLDTVVNSDGWCLLSIPANGFVAYAPAGVERAFPIVPRSVATSTSLYDFSSITVSPNAKTVDPETIGENGDTYMQDDFPEGQECEQ